MRRISYALTLATLAIVGCSSSVSRPHAAPSPAIKLAAGQKARLERGITAPTITMQAGVVAPEVRPAFVTRDKALLPAGSHLAIDAASFHALSSRLATVDALVRGPAPGHWQLVLIKEAGHWQLLSTRRLP